jgi:DNA-binding FadR family transcriptional regulator
VPDSDIALLQRETERPMRLSSAVYDGIVALIARGDFPLNTRMPSEARLSEIFDASRPVVREALARLREDGLVVSRQGSGSYVRRKPDPTLIELAPVGSIDDVQRCFEFREGLEPLAARLAAGRWEPRDMQAIEAAMEALERCVLDGDIGVEQDSRLHEAIAGATHNHYHAQVQRQLRPHITAGMNVTRSLSLRRGERMREVQDEHVRVVDAIRRRDGEEAALHMQVHIQNARRRMFEGVAR